MGIKSDQIGDVVVERIKLKRATFNEVEELKEDLNNNFEKDNIKVVIDLSECKYMDSTFLGALVNNLKRYSQKGGDIKIAGAHSDAEVLLNITGMDRIFSLYASVEEALESFK
ncbi:MAG TPA: STAS domain-containing protein [Ignavibacteriaceae bacterium]|nr:STAS domain-containing protein [Ignavibacteriaceae bacterium]